MTKIKVLHTGDFHIGIPIAGVKGRRIREIRRNDILNNIKDVFTAAIKENVDIVLISGDVFHSPSPKPDDFIEFDSLLRILEEHKIHIVIIAGNHDRPRVREESNYLEIYRWRGRPYIHYFHTPPEYPLILNIKGYRIGIALIPYIIGKFIKAHIKRLGEFRSMYLEVISKILRQQIAKMEELDYKILVGHLTVEGSTLGPRIRYVSYDDPPIPKAMLKPDFFDYIALGHIHKPQRIGGNICYSGSIERMDFSEEDENKGFWIFNLTDNRLEIHPIKCRPMSTIKISVPPLTQPISAIKSSISDLPDESLIRLILYGEAGLVRGVLERIDALEDLLFNQFKVIGYKLEFEYQPSTIPKGVDIERVDFSEALREYIKSKYKGKRSEVIEKAIKYGVEMIEE